MIGFKLLRKIKLLTSIVKKSGLIKKYQDVLIIKQPSMMVTIEYVRDEMTSFNSNTIELMIMFI